MYYFKQLIQLHILDINKKCLYIEKIQEGMDNVNLVVIHLKDLFNYKYYKFIR